MCTSSTRATWVEAPCVQRASVKMEQDALPLANTESISVESLVLSLVTPLLTAC